jgi:HAD superfamily hydrolase (TIGR01662 family)
MPTAVPLDSARLVGIDALLLDAGNTVVFLDHDAVAALVADRLRRADGAAITGADVRIAEAQAKRGYEALLAAGGAHEDGWTLFFVALFGALGIGEPEARAVVPVLRRSHDELNLWRRVPAGLPEALARARAAGLAVGIVSNSEGKLDALFAHVGLADAFVCVVDSAHEGVRKPDPEIFRRALARVGVPASRALYVGDLPSVDVDGARGAGLSAVLVDPFGHYGAYMDAPRVASVVEVVDALLAARRAR